jgi:hypothetical protein
VTRLFRRGPPGLRDIGLLLVLLSGCSSSGGSEGPLVAPDGGVTPAGAAACEQTAPLYCKKLFECARPSAEEMYGTVEACANLDAADCRQLARLADASKTVIGDWAACNRAVGALTCDQWSFGESVAACRFAGGARQTWAACASDLQCASNHCKFERDANTGRSSTCGVCGPPLGIGDACDFEVEDCTWGLRCVERKEPETGQVCIQPAAEGAACDEESDRPCQGDLVCLQGKCARPVSRDGACTRSFQCQFDLRCVGGTCGEPAGAGAPCTSADHICADHLGCRGDVCTPLNPPGAECFADEECETFCSSLGGTRGTCYGNRPVDQVAVGEACAPDASSTGKGNACVYSAFCDPASKRCVARQLDGQPCTDSEQCLGWLSCNAGKCGLSDYPMCGG